MLAALFGQVAFDSGVSYEALFYVSFVSVGAGCVVGCFLPSAPFDKGPGLSPLHTRTPSTRPPTGRTFRDELTRFTKAIRDTVTLVSSRCYGSGVMCVLSGWWVLSSAPPAFLEWYGTSLFDAIDQTHDANGYVVFVARFMMACASVLGGMESFGGTHAANPLLYAGTSGFVCRVRVWYERQWRRRGGGDVLLPRAGGVAGCGGGGVLAGGARDGHSERGCAEGTWGGNEGFQRRRRGRGW